MEFDILDILFLPALFFISIITSYQDFKYEKIKNKWIVLGAGWGIGICLLFSAMNLLGFGSIFSSILGNPVFKGNWLNLIESTFLNSFCALSFGVLLWYLKLWSAGDAKLFFVFSFLLPLKYYFNSYFIIFPSIILFINTILCAFLFLMILSIFYFCKTILTKLPDLNFKNLFKKFHDEFKKIVWDILNGILALATIFLIIKLFLKNLSVAVNAFAVNIIVILLIMIFMGNILNFFKKFNKIIVCLLMSYFIWISIFLPKQIESALSFIFKTGTMFIGFFVIFSIIIAPYVKNTKKTNMAFALYLILGTIITIFLKGSLLNLFL